MPTILDCFFTVSISHLSRLFLGVKIIVAPVIRLAIHFEIASEIKAPPKPKTPEKITSALIFYLNDFSAALGKTERLPVEISVWMPIIVIFIFATVGLIHADQK